MHQGHDACNATRRSWAKRVFNAICDCLVQNKTEGHRPVNREVNLIGLNIERYVVRLLLDGDSQRTQVRCDVDGLRVLTGCQLIVSKRDGVNPIGDMVKRSMDICAIKTPLLNADRR